MVYSCICWGGGGGGGGGVEDRIKSLSVFELLAIKVAREVGKNPRKTAHE